MQIPERDVREAAPPGPGCPSTAGPGDWRSAAGERGGEGGRARGGGGARASGPAPAPRVTQHGPAGRAGARPEERRGRRCGCGTRPEDAWGLSPPRKAPRCRGLPRSARARRVFLLWSRPTADKLALCWRWSSSRRCGVTPGPAARSPRPVPEASTGGGVRGSGCALRVLAARVSGWRAARGSVHARRSGPRVSVPRGGDPGPSLPGVRWEPLRCGTGT